MSEMRYFGQTLGSPRSPGSKWIIGGVALLLLLTAGGVALWLWKRSPPPKPAAPAVEAPPVAQAPPQAPVAPPGPMAKGDELLRQHGQELSSAKEFAKWLQEDNILRRLVAAVNLVAEGNSPRPVLGFLNPGGKFEAHARDGRLFVSPKSYGRYRALTRLLVSIDVTSAGKVYHLVKPYVTAAYSEIGRPGKSLEDAIRQAIARLNSTPIPQGEVELVEKGLLYAYKDPALESLSPAQKHLLRMGPENARELKSWLKKLEEALLAAPM